MVGDITIEDSKVICESLLSREPKDLSIFLSSNGGDVEAALSMGSAIQSLQRQGKRIHMHVGGIAHSAGTLLLQFANYRSMEPYSTMRIHPIVADYEDQTLSISDLQGELDGMKYTHFVYYDILKRRSGMNIEDLFKNDHLAQDILLYPKDCVDWNLIDEVLDYCIPDPKEVTLNASGVGSTLLDFTQRPTAANPKPARARKRKAS